MRLILIILFGAYFNYSQNIDVNDSYNYEFIRNSILNVYLESEYSFNIKPILSNEFLDRTLSR